jgi:hypothetical protein
MVFLLRTDLTKFKLTKGGKKAAFAAGKAGGAAGIKKGGKGINRILVTNRFNKIKTYKGAAFGAAGGKFAKFGEFPRFQMNCDF